MIPLEDALPAPAGVRLRLGVIVSAGSGVCEVTIGGTDVPDVAYLGSAPSTADVVHLLQDGEQFLVLGVQT